MFLSEDGGLNLTWREVQQVAALLETVRKCERLTLAGVVATRNGTVGWGEESVMILVEANEK